MMLSARAESMETLSAGAESIILSTPPAESIHTLSTILLCYWSFPKINFVFVIHKRLTESVTKTLNSR
jgi:hypothetical protein